MIPDTPGKTIGHTLLRIIAKSSYNILVEDVGMCVSSNATGVLSTAAFDTFSIEN